MSNPNNYNMRQSGFTLIELMISLVLGLLISAAVMQVYLISVKTSSVQASGSELQDASIFGIQQLEKKVRLANLGNPATRIDSTTAKGGIVLTGANLGATQPYTDTGYLTRRAGDSASGTNGWTGASNTNIDSDQLTIQYTNITGSPFSDCEGATVEINETAVERYFLRPVTNDTSSGAIKNLVLACDAGRVTNTTPATIATYGGSDTRNFGRAGQEFITNVDQFKVLLGTQSDSGSTAGQLMYLPSNSYLDITNKPAITAVKMGLIVHGSTPVLGSEDQTSFVLLGQSNNLKNDTSRSKQVRTTYETTTLLRNARVVNVKTGL
jgi:type IV pilus assembly protein PilW